MELVGIALIGSLLIAASVVAPKAWGISTWLLGLAFPMPVGVGLAAMERAFGLDAPYARVVIAVPVVQAVISVLVWSIQGRSARLASAPDFVAFCLATSLLMWVGWKIGSQASLRSVNDR